MAGVGIISGLNAVGAGVTPCDDDQMLLSDDAARCPVESRARVK